MAWISVHESVDGPKLRNLYKRLGCSKFEAVGILNFLWFWGLTNAEKDGLILYADKEDIERYLYGVGSGCNIPAKKIVDALFDCGWLEWQPLGIVIHDWEVWQDQWYKAKEAREKDARRKREYRQSRAVKPEKPEETDAAVDAPADNPPDAPVDAEPEPPAESEKADAGSPPETPPEKPKAKYTPDFDVWWAAYPRKEEKGNAYKKYMARIHEGFSPEELLLAAKNYALQCRRQGTEKRYIKHPKTFLSDSRPFMDYLPKQKEPPAGEQAGGNPFAEFEEGADGTL